MHEKYALTEQHERTLRMECYHNYYADVRFDPALLKFETMHHHALNPDNRDDPEDWQEIQRKDYTL